MTAITREWLCWDDYSDKSERVRGNTHECGVPQDLLASTAAVSEYSVYGTPVNSKVRKDVQTVPRRIKLCMYGHTCGKSMDQPGKVANPACGQLSRENEYVSAFAPENLVSRDGFGSPVPRQPAYLHTRAESGAYLRDSSRVPRRRRPFMFI